MERQHGFYFDSDRCVQCHACEVACKSWNELELGIKWRRVADLWAGQFPKISNKTVSFSCMHCGKPACVEICPAKAISKRSEDGIVAVDQAKCTGCRSCSAACPFHIPQYGQTGKMQKCNSCIERLQKEKLPSCVETCPGEALKFGPLNVLVASSTIEPAKRLTGRTNPAFLFSGRLNQAELHEILKS
jgi:anaerobic dimethyl sulfoxide reductase subunit B (iron-sulfur subunit)